MASNPAVEAKQSRSTGQWVLRVTKALLAALLHFVVFVALSRCFLAGMEIYEKLYNLYELPLPAPTRLAIDVANNLRPYRYLPTLYFLLINPLVLLALALLPDRQQWLRRTWTLGFVLFAFFALAWLFIAASMPLINFKGQAAPYTLEEE